MLRSERARASALSALTKHRSQLLRDATYNLSEVPSVGRLPVLTASNFVDHTEWYNYVRHIFGVPVALPIDLNKLSFFYWPAPLPLSRLYLCDWREAGIAEVPFGTPWIGGVGSWQWGPEHLVRRAGFFVHRRPWARDALLQATRLEVMRVGPLKSEASIFDERGRMWFYHAVGSGIFVRAAAFVKLELQHRRHNSVPRVEICGHLSSSQASSYAARNESRDAAFWPNRVAFVLKNGTACESRAIEHRILSCVNVPMPIWPGDDDPVPRWPSLRPCANKVSPDWSRACMPSPARRLSASELAPPAPGAPSCNNNNNDDDNTTCRSLLAE